MNPEDYADNPEQYHRADMMQRCMLHAGHRIQITLYGTDRKNPHNASIECMRCHEVIIDWDHPDMDESGAELPATDVSMVKTSRGWHPDSSTIAQREHQA